jgi:large repetitive protein
MSQSNMNYRWSRVLRGTVAVCGAVLILGLLCTVLIGTPPAVIGEAEGPEATTDLQIDKVGPDSILAGDLITYTLLVTNNTALPLDGVIITDTWLSQTYTGTYTTGGAVSVVTAVYTGYPYPTTYSQFSLATLPPNSSGYIQIVMAITTGLQPRYTTGPTVLANSAVITTSTPGVTGTTDSVNTLIVGPILVITKTVTPTTVRPGQLLTYTLYVYNRYRSDAIEGTNVVITEKLPNNVIFQNALPPGIATFFPATGTVQWNWPGTVPVSTSAIVTVMARMAPTATYGIVQNSTNNCGVRATGLPLGILCSQNVNVQVDDVFEKVGRTVSPPAQTDPISRTFPNRIMTYTVSVYNPFTETVNEMRVTDTLPTYSNNPTQTFYYSGLLAAGAPGLPTVVSQTSRLVAWQLPALQPSSVYTFSFLAFVPPQMRIDDNNSDKTYQNSLAGSYAGIVLPTNNGGNDNSMKVKVVRQIELIKTVTPTSQMYGQPVTYTLVVSNAGPTAIRDIQLSDVLPTSSDCWFEWDGLVSGQVPISTTSNLASWSGVTLTGYAQTTLATFRAIVYGKLNASCGNTVQGYSPDTYIVKRTGLAPVTVLVPFRYNKTVNPTSVILGGQIQYTVQQFNVGTIPAHMYVFEDYLPSGFKHDGNSVYSETVDLWLQPNGAIYQTTFPVDVLGTPQPCDNLPKSIPQARGSFGMGIDSPPELEGFWVNASDAANVTVYPQATASKVADPPGALPGGVITFTITLSNNTSSAIGSLRVTDTLPNNNFVFGGSLPGTPDPFAIVPPNVFWQPLTIPANGKLTLAFTVTAPLATGNFQNVVKAGSLVDSVICIPKYTSASFPVAVGKVEVSKQATPSSVNPLEQFQYNVSLKNSGPFTVTVSRFTETLPGVSGYTWKYVSMYSGDPLPVSTDPPAWADLTIGPNTTKQLRFNVRASYQVGLYPNLAPPTAPAPLAGYMTGTVPSGWVLTKTTNYNNAPVTVAPGVGVAKDVYPEAITLPQQSTVIYTITVVNVSGDPVNNLRITDTLPTGFTYKDWVGGDLPQQTNPPIWLIGSMPNNTTKLLSFRAQVTALQPSGTYYNRLNVSADNLFVPATGDIAPVKVKGLPTLNLSKSVTPAVVIAGRSVTYTLSLHNPDPSDPVTARVTDTLPSGFTFAEMISGPAPLVTGSQVVWALDVPSDTTQVISFRAVISSSTPDGIYYNQLDGSSSQIVFPGTGATAPVLVQQPIYDVQVAKSDAAYTATIGSETVYTIRYTNTQNALGLTASGVVLTETFAPADYLVADAPDWSLAAPGVYTYFVGDLPAGAAGQVTFGLQIDNGIPVQYTAITNTVEIGNGGAIEIPEAIEQPTANNVAVDVDLIRGADLAVKGVTYAPASPAVGRPMTVVVTLENRGLDSAIGPDNDGWFDTDLYVKPVGALAPVNAGDRYLGACPTITNYCPDTVRTDRIGHYGGGGLLPGETTTLTYTIKPESSGWQWLYLQADTFWGVNGDPDPAVYGSSAHGRVFETDESNNIYGPIPIFANSMLYLPLIRK